MVLETHLDVGLGGARKTHERGQERDSKIPVGALSHYRPLFIQFWSSYTSDYRITARCTSNGWPSNVKRTEKSDLPSLINWGRFHCFMWFATSSSSRFILSFNGCSSLRLIPIVGSAPSRISSAVESRTVLIVFFCYGMLYIY
jgi:hypothetical protein